MLDLLQAGRHRAQPLVQLQPRGLQGRAAVVGHGRAGRRAVAPDRVGLGIVAALEPPLDRPDAPDLLLELDLGVAIGFVDRRGGLSKIMGLAELTPLG